MQTASAVHGGGYVSQRIVNFNFKHDDLRHARRGAFLVAFVAQSHSQFEMRAPEIGQEADSGFELLNGAGRFAAIGQQVPKVQARSGEAGLQANWPLARRH